MIFDTTLNKYVSMGGYGDKEMTMDPSDKDYFVNQKSSWGTSGVKSYGNYMPDVIKSFTSGGTYYFITANEGGTRDGKDLIGMAGDFEGEESRTKDYNSLTCTTSGDTMCKDDTELGRVLTTAFAPADFAINACGTNLCSAWQLNQAAQSSWDCVMFGADYGGRDDIYDNRAHPDCGYATMVGIYVDSMDKTGQTVRTPTSGYTPVRNVARNSTITSGGITVTSAFSFPGWFSGPTGADPSITGPAECMAKCAATSDCDHWSYEFERGYHECFLKATHSTAHCNLYIRWTQHWSNGDPWGRHWEGYAGPKTCTAPAPYTTTRYATAGGHGHLGGHASIGGRSFTIWSWDGSPGSALTMVYDSGREFEDKQKMMNGGNCDVCMASANRATCERTCAFNSDDWPPKMDDRSDAKGPEPECVDTGVMSDGTRLAFIGLERTGGIMTYDITNPAGSTFQDYLNVKNWRVGETIGDDAEKVAKNLNDGPESLVFISAADSPLGQELLLAATPLAGRLTAYIIEQGPLRGNDGSCPNTTSCPYLSVSTGGTGEYRNEQGSTYDKCSLAVGAARRLALGCTYCGSGTSYNQATAQCEITCSAGRRMEEEQSLSNMSETPAYTTREAVKAYMAEHPEFAKAHPEIAMGGEDMMMHLEKLSEQLFGQPVSKRLFSLTLSLASSHAHSSLRLSSHHTGARLRRSSVGRIDSPSTKIIQYNHKRSLQLSALTTCQMATVSTECASRASVSAFGPGTFWNIATNQCEVECTSSNGRRLEALPLTEPPETASAVINDFLKVNPEFASYLSKSVDAKMINYMEKLSEQLFGQPALA